MTPEYLIIHHTATDRDRTTFEAVRQYHIRKGWGDIGYHYFITADGTLWKGRAESEVGAHAQADGMNFKSIGICLTGNFEVERPTDAQITTLETTLERLRAEYSISREQVLGHQEVPNAHTLCPGKNLLAWIQDYRKKEPQPDLKAGLEKQKKELKIKIIDFIQNL